MASTEASIAEFNRQLADPAVYDDPEKVKGLAEEFGRAKDRASQLMDDWERSQAELDGLEKKFA